MAISNELSGEIAAALLTKKRMSPLEISHLKETLLKVHSVLQQMTADQKSSSRRDLLGSGGDDGPLANAG